MEQLRPFFLLLAIFVASLVNAEVHFHEFVVCLLLRNLFCFLPCYLQKMLNLVYSFCVWLDPRNAGEEAVQSP
jgi:hypothetical protein